MNITKALEFAVDELRSAEITEPEREASSLLRFVLKRDAAFVYSHPEYQLDAVESIMFKAVVKRREAREPFQHITGKQEFFGLEFSVSKDVLIPRPETELIVETVIERFRSRDDLRFLEIGVGSGCISVSILKNLSKASAVGVDVSEAALSIARRNAGTHQVTERLKLVNSDLFESVDGEQFDLIVSNPPYIATCDIEKLQPEVRDHEPRSAVDGGESGLDIVRDIVERSPGFLHSGAPLMMEIGFDQSPAVGELFDPNVWQNIEFLRDVQSIDRTVLATRK